MVNNNLYEKAYKYAITIVELYRKIISVKKEFVISKQILKSGTSIGANIAESKGAISDADYTAKLSIAYKESLETKYWLDLLKDTSIIQKAEYDKYFADCDELSKILYSILKINRIKPNTDSK